VESRYWYPLHIEDGTEILPLVIDIFGMQFSTELLARDPSHLDEVPDEGMNKYIFPVAAAA
jgi:hypothetical protein